MERVGLHADTELTSELFSDPLPDLRAGSVAQVADELDRLAGELDGVTARVAVLVRDGGTDPDLGAAARDLMSAAGRITHAAELASALALTQLEVTAGHIEDAVPSPRVWAENQAGLSRTATSVARRVNQTLARYPLLAAAFIDGRLRSFHLSAVDSIIPSRFRGPALRDAIALLVDVQGELLTVAGECLNEAEFRRFCRQVRDRLDIDGEQPDGSDDSTISIRKLANGRWSLQGDLNEADGLIWATAIVERNRKLIHTERETAKNTAKNAAKNNKNAVPVPPEPDLETEGGVIDALHAEMAGDRKTHRARLADAATSLLLDGAGATKAGRVGLFVHINLEDLEDRGADIVPKAHSEADYDITVDSLWALLADADVTPIICDTGTPLTYGRTHRLAPDILKRILNHRDRRCPFKACEVASYQTDKHHTIEWDNGGTTDPITLKNACKFHHHLCHDHGWDLKPPNDGRPGDYNAHRPDGTPHDPTPRWQKNARQRDHIEQLIRQRINNLAAQFNHNRDDDSKTESE